MLRNLAGYLSEYARDNPRQPWVRPPGMGYIEEYAIRLHAVTYCAPHTLHASEAVAREASRRAWLSVDPRDYITDDEMRKWAQ